MSEYICELIEQKELLKLTVERLISVLELPLPAEHDDTVDLPQVHALNILKAVVREKAVANTIIPYLSTLTVHAITGFASQYWAIRNASTQLFGEYSMSPK